MKQVQNMLYVNKTNEGNFKHIHIHNHISQFVSTSMHIYEPLYGQFPCFNVREK